MTTKQPTLVQIETRRASMEKLLDGPGGEQALRQLLTERLDSEVLYDVLKAQLDRGNDLFDTYDAIKTFCELDSEADAWRLVKRDEVLDEEKHIDCEDKDAVFYAADSLGLKVFMDEESMNDNDYFAVNDPKLAEIVLEAEPFSDTVGKLIAKQCAESVYEFDGLASWLELYGLELRRRGSRVA